MSLKVEIKKKVKNFQLDIAFETDGGCLGILGASGCGKSMTLRCIAGIMTPDEGHIELNGRVLYDSRKKINVRPQARGVGYLFQNYALFPNMTVEQNIAAGLKKSAGDVTEKVNHMIRLFQLEGLEQRRPGQLSGGQQQRVALARILAYEPEVMLFDEPFSALDAYLKEELQIQFENILELYRGDAVLVTHSRDEAYQTCRRVCMLDEGRIIRQGETKEVFRNPGFMKVARLTGCKNISAAKKLDGKRVWAADWGLTLEVEAELPEHFSHIGIRAHDFMPANEQQVIDGSNIILCKVKEISESPFEWSILIETPAANHSLLWWKIGKNQIGSRLAKQLPDTLYIAPQDILVMEDNH